MKEAGVVSSTGEVRRNRPEYCINLDEVDCINIKCGVRSGCILLQANNELFEEALVRYVRSVK